MVPCVVEVEGEGRGHARFRAPRLPEIWGEARDPAEIAWALGIDPREIGFDRHAPSRHSAGVAFDFVPVASLDAVGRARPSADAFAQGVRRRASVGLRLHAADDRTPAIISTPACSPRASASPRTRRRARPPPLSPACCMQFEPLGDGEHDFIIEQGYEMGRPSDIALQLVIERGRLASVEIGGAAVLVSEGTLRL